MRGLRPLSARDLALARQFLLAYFPILAARQRSHEGDQIVDLRLGRCTGALVLNKSQPRCAEASIAFLSPAIKWSKGKSNNICVRS
jgi:hypothetical protein